MSVGVFLLLFIRFKSTIFHEINNLLFDLHSRYQKAFKAICTIRSIRLWELKKFPLAVKDRPIKSSVLRDIHPG